jgi:hypothetical protein
MGLALACAALAAAQTRQRVDQPVLGYVAGDQQVRAVLGIPGASRLGEPRLAPAGVLRLRMAPGHRWALAWTDLGWAVWNLDHDNLYRFAATGADAIVFSPSGSWLGLYDQARGTMDLFDNLENGPQRQRSVALVQPTGFALSDTGLLAFSSQGRLMLSEAGGTRFVTLAPDLFAFAPQSNRLYAVVSNNLSEWTDLLTTPRSRVLWSGLSPKVDMLVVADQVLAASRAENSLWEFDPASRQSVESSFSGDRIEVTRLPGLYLIKGSAGEPAALRWQGRLLFAAPEATTGGEQ